jgi:hypothetical protein
VPSAGLLPAAVLAERVGLAGLVDRVVTVQRHGANSGTKALTVIGSVLAGGDSIDDVDLLRAGAAAKLFDRTRAPSTIGSWLRGFKWFNVRQLDAVSRELVGRLGVDDDPIHRPLPASRPRRPGPGQSGLGQPGLDPGPHLRARHAPRRRPPRPLRARRGSQHPEVRARLAQLPVGQHPG